VVTSRGRNGFSSLSQPANKISLLEIYKAVEAPPVFSIHEYPREKTCRTSCTHKQAMVELLEDTQRAFEARLGQRMLSEMVALARTRSYEGKKITSPSAVSRSKKGETYG
jgi:DNA-binding IscR family transcriptional regulator